MVVFWCSFSIVVDRIVPYSGPATFNQGLIAIEPSKDPVTRCFSMVAIELMPAKKSSVLTASGLLPRMLAAVLTVKE